jgi:cell division protein FtsL
MTFTGEIQLGQLVTAISVIVGFISSYYAVKGRLTVLENLVSDLTEKIEKIEGRLESQQQNLADLNAEVFPHKRGRRVGDH